MVIPPQFGKACGFTEGLAVVQLNERLGYIDERGSRTAGVGAAWITRARSRS